MKEYVVGFCFNPTFEEVLLIQKAKPEWQKGRYNGVGGLVEDPETLLAAMRREFEEETGLQVDAWTRYLTLATQADLVHFFWTTFAIERAMSMTIETVRRFPVLEVLTPDVEQKRFLGNVPWLLSMALAMADGREATKLFYVYEMPNG